MADPKTQMLQVSLPGAGQTTTYQMTADVPVKFTFDISEAVFTGNNGNLTIAIENGGTVVLENYQALADAGSMPIFEMLDGEQVAGDVYLFAFADGVDGADAGLETAGDANGGGSGAGEYSDDPGQIGDGVDALGGQSDAYASRALTAVSGTAGDNTNPIANDDFNEITEIGDADFNGSEHVTFVSEEEELYDSDLEGDFFSLGEEGKGFVVNYQTDGPQIQEPIEGNVIDNDFDPDASDSNDTLLMHSIDYDGVDSTGQNPGPVEIPSTGQTVEGLYGTLVIQSDGSYIYTLNEDLADSLEEGEDYDEVFNYTIEDPSGSVSNQASLTITVHGSNDAPTAVADTNVQAVEHGDSDGPFPYIDTEQTGLSDGEEEYHPYSEGPYNASGNVLENDSDVDDNDMVNEPGEESGLFVMGVYSEHPSDNIDDQLDYDASLVNGGLEGAVEPSQASFSVQGHYGSLTINNDGSYTYTLDNDGENADLEALNYDNSGTDSFTYAIMDDSGALSYANLTFTVNGANDAPEAFSDANSIREFGHIFEDVEYIGTVTGNVITDVNADGDVDSDADDTQIFVETISHGDNTQAVYDYDGTNEYVDIDGDYGTLRVWENGEYEYTLDNENGAVNALDDGGILTETFSYVTTNDWQDGVSSDSADLTITINGTNDAPIAVNDVNTASEAVDDAALVPATGNVLTDAVTGDSDVDTGDVLHIAGIQYGSQFVNSFDAEGNLVIVGTYGTLKIDADGNYTYEADQDAANELAAGSDPVDDVFTYSVTDGDVTSTATLTISVSGVNDSATISVAEGVMNDEGVVIASVNETDDNANTLEDLPDGAQYQSGSDVVEPDGGNLTIGGSLEVSDPDVHEVNPDPSVPGNTNPDIEDTFQPLTDAPGSNGYGTFTINADGDWTYTASNDQAAIQQLGDGESLTDSVTVTSYDGTATQVITVTINGTNDAPVITNVSAPVEDFEDGADGWLVNGGDVPVTETDGPLTDYLGRLGGNDTLTKTFAVADGTDTMTIEFDLYEIDSWDNENFIMSVNGDSAEINLGHNDALNGTILSWRGIDGEITDGTFTGPNGVTFTVTPMTGDAENLEPGDTWQWGTDQIHHVTITIPNPDGQVDLEFSADLDSHLNDESFGIDNLAVSSVDADGNPIFTVVENVTGSVAVAELASSDMEGQDVHYVINKIEISDTEYVELGADGQYYDQDGNPVDSADLMFAIDGNQVVTADGATFDYEANNQYTISVSPVDSQGGVGQSVDINVQIGNVNEAPSGEDFTMTVGLDGGSVDFLGADGSEGGIGDNADHVSDPEDDADALDVMITELPTGGKLMYNGQEVTEADLASDADGDGIIDDNGTQFDLNGLTYVPDSDGIDGVLLGSRLAGDVTLDNWGESDGLNRVMDLGDGVSVTTSVTSDGVAAELQQFHGQANHIGFGIADATGNGGNDKGLNAGPDRPGSDELTVRFNGATVSYAEIGFDGLGGHFDPDANGYQNATAEWTAYLNGEEVNSGSVSSDGDLFNSITVSGFEFDTIVFSTASDADGSNWELRYIDAEFTDTDSFDYIPVDSGQPGNDGALVDPDGASTVTINIQPDGPVNQEVEAADDFLTINEDDTTATGLNVGDNDIDLDNTLGELEFSLDNPADAPEGLTFNPDGSYTFDPSFYQSLAAGEVYGDGPIKVDYTVFDGETHSKASLYITITGSNDTPTLDLSADADGFNFADTYVENAAPISITGDADIADVDHNAMVSKATVSYTPLEDADVTALDLNLPTGWDATSSVDPVTGEITWTITGPNGDDMTMGDFESVLDGITFGNAADESPLDGDREFTITVYDDQGEASNSAVSTITVESENDAPTLDLSAGTVTFEGHTAGYHNMIGVYEMVDGKPVNPEIIMEDVQDANVGDVLTTFGDGQDLHYFLVDVGYGSTPTGTPEFVWDAANNEWDISFDGGTTTQNVHFDDATLNPNDSEATFGDSLNNNNDIEVDDQQSSVDDDDFDDVLADENPGAAGADHGATFTEGDAPLSVTGAVDISDVDSDTITKVEITYTPEEHDALDVDLGSFVDEGTVTNSDGSVTWTISGDASKADYEELLQSLTFENDSETLQDGTREITIRVNDGEDWSNPAQSTITVVGVDDPTSITDHTDGAVHEDAPADLDGNGFLVESGSVTFSDADGDGAMNTTHIDAVDANGNVLSTANVGTLTINDAGVWEYKIDNSLPEVQNQDRGESFDEYFRVYTEDGNDFTDIKVTVNGEDDNRAPNAVNDLAGGADTSATEGGISTSTNPSDYMLIVDTSGSLSHTAMAQTQTALTNMLHTLQGSLADGATSKVSIINFWDRTDIDTFTLTGGDSTAYDAAVGFIGTFSPGGGTDYTAAFRAATALLGPDPDPTQVIFMSDGEPTEGGNGWKNLITPIQDNPDVNLIAVGVNMPAQYKGNMDLIDEGNDASMLDGNGLNGLLQDVLSQTTIPATTAEGNVLTNDSDPDGDALSVISIANDTDTVDLVDSTNDGVDNPSATIVGTYGTLTINGDGSYEYTPDQAAANALNQGDSETESFTYTISDGNGGEASATVSFEVNGANDAPVAINDSYQEINITSGIDAVLPTYQDAVLNDFSTAANGSVTNDGITISVSHWSNNQAELVQLPNGELGIDSGDGNQQIDSDGHYGYEEIRIDVSEGADAVNVTVGSIDSNDDVEVWVYFEGTDHVFNRSYSDNYLGNHNNTIELGGWTDHRGVFHQIDYIEVGPKAQWGNYDNFTISSVSVPDAIMTDPGSAAIPAEIDFGSFDNGTGAITGDVLANDFDVDTGDTLSVIDVNGDDVSASGQTTIHGTYGDLTIEADGSYDYTLHDGWQDLDHTVTETFEYTVSDSHGATDVANLEIPIHVDANVVTDAALDTATGDYVMDGTIGEDLIYIADDATMVNLTDGGDDTIIVDPDYIGTAGGDITVSGFGDGDELVLNDMGDMFISIDHSGNDTVLTINEGAGDVNPGDDYTITLTDYSLHGVDQMDLPTGHMDISSDHESLNSLIQTIIDSPDKN